MADQDRSEWIKRGMESLMGVVLVRQLKKRLTQYLSNRRQGTNAIDKAELDHMLLVVKKKEEDLDRYCPMNCTNVSMKLAQTQPL